MTEGWKITLLGKVCKGCTHLSTDVVEGKNEYRCKHQTAIARLGVHPMHQVHGILIGKNPYTPNWCPVGRWE